MAIHNPPGNFRASDFSSSNRFPDQGFVPALDSRLVGSTNFERVAFKGNKTTKLASGNRAARTLGSGFLLLALIQPCFLRFVDLFLLDI